MKISAFLRCIGLVLLWFVLLQMFSILFQNANITLLLSILLMGIIVFCVNRKNNYINFIPKEKLGTQIILSILTGVGLSFFNAISVVLMILNGKWELMDVYIDNFILLFISTILGAIVEELFFRGILMNICRPYFNVSFTIIIPSVIFALLHFSPERMFHTFVGGVLFGYLYYYTKNIYTSIIMHVVTNMMWSPLLNGYIFAFIGSKIGYLSVAILFSIIGFAMIVCLKIIFDKEFVKNRQYHKLNSTRQSRL